MRLRRILATILACLLMLTMLSACSANDSAGEWDRNVDKHWHVSENGKQKNVSSHKVVDNVCSVCGSEIWEYDDGSADIYNYTESGNFLRLTSYDADGNITADTKYEYEYDENGHVVLEKQYESDMLVQEIEYVVSLDGESIMASQTFYFDDGTRNVSECDGNGNVIKELIYDANGFETVTTEYAYTYTTDVDFFLSTKIEYFDDGSKHIIDYNTYGDIIHWYGFDAYGSSEFDMHYEYEYDADGNMTYSNEYSGSILTNEYEYALDADGYSYCVKETVYNEDETITYYEYDENSEIINEFTVDASGNVIG